MKHLESDAAMRHAHVIVLGNKMAEKRSEKRAAPRPAFRGFPERTLLDAGDIPIAEIAAIALREGQSTSPLYRTHRWFARRLGSQFRAILTGLQLPAGSKDFWQTYLSGVDLRNAVVLDPFVGGGTSLVEAARCGASVVGYDVDPVASLITRFELGAASSSIDREAVTTLCDRIAGSIRPFHVTRSPEYGTADVLHHFWVQLAACPDCGGAFEVHPHYRLAYDKEKSLQWVFCSACHEVRETRLAARQLRCACGKRTSIDAGTLVKGKAKCPHCKALSDLSAQAQKSGSPPEWRLFAQEYLLGSGKKTTRHFKRVDDQDRELFSQAASRLTELKADGVATIPTRSIPAEGRTDGRPQIHGIKKYRDLFNSRQLLHLSLLANAIREVGDGPLRQFLSVAFSEHLTTNCMYAGYAFGYRRISPLFSIHSYRHICRPVELNPWMDGIGRGTFPNATKKLFRAAAFAAAPSQLSPLGGTHKETNSKLDCVGAVSRNPGTVARGTRRAAIKTSSSEKLQDLADRSVDLVLTDPPYFDNISYSELSDFYLSWHQTLGIAEPPFDDPDKPAPIQNNMAVTRVNAETTADYTQSLARVFSECNRVLKAQGICVFTYHHKSLNAWACLGTALAQSGLRCERVLPMRGEGQGGLHSYDGTIKWDAVFLCKKGHKPKHRYRGQVCVSVTAVSYARSLVSQYVDQLAAVPRIGFREQDQRVLALAHIASRAQLNGHDPTALSLTEALKQCAI